jgi:hypothetical protein
VSTEAQVDFLRARLDEDDAVIRRNRGQHGVSDGGSFPDYRTYDTPDAAAADDYLRHFRPPRLLAQVEAARLILNLHRPDDPVAGDPICTVCLYTPPCETLRALTAVYAAHPDYRPEWRAEGASRDG